MRSPTGDLERDPVAPTRADRFREAFGWYGAAIIIVAYVLLSFGLIQSDSLAYQAMNLTGAMGIVAVSLSKRVFQSVVLNSVWTLIAFVALIRILL